MPLMEVVLQQQYQNQEIINRWNYMASGTPATVTLSFALTSALGAIAVAGVYDAAKLMRKIADIQVSAVSFILLTVRSVYSTTDFYSLPFIEPLVGQAAQGDAVSPIVAYGFRTNRVRSDIRRATKRFVGVGETAMAAGGTITGAFLTTQLAALATAMGASLTYVDEGNTLTFAPVVVGKEKYNPNPSDPTAPQVAYRYYATEALQGAHIAQGIVWDPYTQVRSQVSRQFGHGR